MRISIRNRLIATFLAVVILPLGITAGFYYIYTYKILLKGPEGPTLDFPKQAINMAQDVANLHSSENGFTGLDSVLHRYKDAFHGRIQILNKDGNVLADSTPGEGPVADQYSLVELAESFNLPTNDTNMGQLKDHDMQTVAPIKVKGATVGLVIMSVPYLDYMSPILGSLKGTLVVAISAIIAIILFFAWLISRGITRPLKELVTATRVIAKGNLDSRVKITTRNELGELGDAFNTMVENLQRSLLREKNLENSRRELIANVSHDLRTPLTSIRGYVEGLQDGVAQEPEKMRRYLDVIYEKTLGLDRLIEDLFHLSQLDAGQLEMKPGVVGATNLFAGIAHRFKSDIEAVSLHANIDIPNNLPLVKVDQGRIQQALGNVVENAIKYTPGGGSITIKAWAEDKQIVLIVADTGEGINPDDLPHIFERLYRGEKSRSRQLGGTGLGLAIAKQIIEANGGRIRVESQKGEGSKFYICFDRFKVG